MLINNNEHHVVPNLIDLQNKKLITSACQIINRIQHKSFCLHNVYIYFVYIETNTYSRYFEKYLYLFIFI